MKTFTGPQFTRRIIWAALAGAGAMPLEIAAQGSAETRDPRQQQDADFARAYADWTKNPQFGSPLVDHLPRVAGVPTPKDILGYHIGAPSKLTYYADILRYYRALEKATQRVKVERIGRSDEGRELVVVWVSSEENIRNLAQNRANLAKIADPRGRSEAEIRQIVGQTKPNYHFMGGLHSGETGPPEMLMELVYRLATETSPFITQIRNNVIVSVTPAAEPDGRDRNIDWFYRSIEDGTAATADSISAAEAAAAARAGGAGVAAEGRRGGRGGQPGAVNAVPYWGKYVHHDNNRDINLSQVSMRAIVDWYFTAHPPIMHDLHESLALLYTFSGGPPQNPNLDPILFAELPFFSNWELAQLTKWGMPGVYTHAFMDGWSPGYLGAVAYNHNGMMRMYETQSGREGRAPVVRPTRVAGRGGRGDEDSASVAQAGRAGGGGGRGGRGVPTGRGGGQPREWYRGIAIPDSGVPSFTRRNNTNYMQTGVLSALQLTAMIPQTVLENFYLKTRNSIDAGSRQAPYGYVIPAQREMTRVATLVNILRAQGIEVGRLTSDARIGSETFKTGSYVIKLNQPYGRLAKNLLEKQDYPDPALTTYDDSGWSMGWAFNVDVKEIQDSTILRVSAPLITSAEVRGTVAGSGNAGLAVAHLGSNNTITFRYTLKGLRMQIAEQPFTADGITFPAGSYVVTGPPAELQAARAKVSSLGLTAAALSSLPSVATHDGDAPRVAIYSQWTGTQDLGWYRHAFDQFGIPFDLIYKERVARGNLKADYDVIIMAVQNLNRATVLAKPAARPVPYLRTAKYQFLGMYGQSADMTGGFGAAGVEAIEKFLEEGGTLITAHSSSRFPIEFGLSRTVEMESPAGVSAQKPLIQAEITRPDHPVFYGYGSTIIPVKFGQNAQVFRIGVADSANVLARYVGGDSAVLSGLMTGAGNLRGRAFAVDIPRAYAGKGRVIMFASNPVYRWQNHGEFNLLFNAILNWNDVPATVPATTP